MQATQPGLISSALRILVPISGFLKYVRLQWVVTKATHYAIRNYQRYISPYKGFSCAHRVLHGGESCSEYFRQLVARDDLSQAVARFQQRLGDCHQAHQMLRLQRQRAYAMEGAEPPEDDSAADDRPLGDRHRGYHRKRSSTSTNWCRSFNGCNDCGGVSSIPSFEPCDSNHNGTCDAGDCGGVDVPDISGCDIGGCDIAGCACNF